MDQPEKPLDWWERGGVGKTRAIALAVAILLSLSILFREFSDFYDSRQWLKNLLAGLAALLTLILAALEYRHSGEANEHRRALRQEIQKANTFYEQANTYSEEANKFRGEIVRLEAERLNLQIEVHQLQQDIEKRVTKIRVYARVLPVREGPLRNQLQLFVSNLSDFDVWVNQVEVIVTEGGKQEPYNRTIDGATRLSRGKMEDGYIFWGTLMRINKNIGDRFDAKFHVKVVVTGVDEKSVTILSPKYQVQLVPGGAIELVTLGY